MFSSKHYINNIALFLFAFINSLLILIISYELRLVAVLIFLGYLIIFPALSYITRGGLFQRSRFTIVLLFIILLAYLGVLFFGYRSPGVLPALSVIFYCLYLANDASGSIELTVRMLMLISSSVIIIEILFNGILVPAVLLLIIIIYLQKRSLDTQKPSYTFYIFALLSGAILTVFSPLIIIYCFFVLYSFRDNLYRLGLFAVISLTAFFLIVWVISGDTMSLYLDQYFHSSLFSSMPLWLLILFMLVVFIAGWLTADIQEVYYVSGLFITIPILLFLILNILKSGVNGFRALDYLTDMELAVPLFISAIKDYKVDRFRGKIKWISG